MPTALEIALLFFAGIGHVVLWVAIVNRLHSLAIPYRLIGALSFVCWTVMLGVLAAVAIGFIYGALHWVGWLYYIPCIFLGGYSLGRRLDQRRGGDPAILLSNHTEVVDVAESHPHPLASNRTTGWMARLPKNEVFRFHLQRKTLEISRLPADLEGLTIAHLSDLHISGRIEAGFYEAVVEKTNQQKPDIIAITGDLFDHQDCIEWGAKVLGRLRARYGVYFILGNHDQRLDAVAIRKRLVSEGMVDLGGAWTKLEISTHGVVLAGNELPWFVPAAEMENCREPEPPNGPLRILLSHAPDQIEWSRRFDFDLMLAGHTHGGQIRLPWLGPVVAPSRLGTQFASGTFHLPPTVMHVSRGISSLTPLRWNCPPELAVLVLTQ